MDDLNDKYQNMALGSKMGLRMRNTTLRGAGASRRRTNVCYPPLTAIAPPDTATSPPPPVHQGQS